MLELFNENLNRAYSNPKTIAQKALEGRTYYVGNDELKFFNAKILECSISPCAKYCLIVESLPAGITSRNRIKRGKVFNIMGRIVATSEPVLISKKNAVIMGELFSEVDKLDANYWKDIEHAIRREFAHNLGFINSQKSEG